MRKAQAKKLPLAPDPRFNDKNVTRFVNCLMLGGNKTTVLSAFYDAIDKVSKITSEDGYEVWKKALQNVTPAVEVRSRRIGGGVRIRTDGAVRQVDQAGRRPRRTDCAGSGRAGHGALRAFRSGAASRGRDQHRNAEHTG